MTELKDQSLTVQLTNGQTGQPQTAQPEPDVSSQLVLFTLSDETYGVDIHRVREIIRIPEITRIPRTPDFIEGVINLRGGVIPVVDLRKRFNLPAPDREELADTGRIVVMDMRDWTIGMMVDGVSEVLRVQASAVEPPSPYIVSTDTRFIAGVVKDGDRLVVLLDLDAVFFDEEKEQIAGLNQVEPAAG